MNSAPSYFQKTWFYNNTPVNGLSSHLNLLEAFNPDKSDDANRMILENGANASLTNLFNQYHY
ncbi:MAG TPA: hypothetical protein VLC98_08470 [Phnomibacter sp.]|nr:hypothetical protein [Phnomibacter sp.]